MSIGDNVAKGTYNFVSIIVNIILLGPIRNKRSGISVKNHRKKPHDFFKENQNKFVWNYTEIIEKQHLSSGGARAGWKDQKKNSEQLMNTA